MSITHLLNAEAAVSRRDPQQARRGGGWQANFVLIDTALPVRRPWGANAREQIIGAKRDEAVTHVSYTEPDADVRKDDTWLVEGVTYRVLGTLQPSEPHHLNVQLEAVQDAAG